MSVNNNQFAKVFDIVIALIIMFLIPITYFGQKQDSITQSNLNSITYKSFSNIATSGYLTKSMYNDFLSQLNYTGTIYKVSLELKEKILEPEYRMKTVDEIIDERDSTWGGENNYNYRPVSTEKPIVNEQPTSGNMNTETNESIIAKSINSPPNPNHIHNDACYNGIKHTHSVYGGSCYQYYQGSEYWVSHTHNSYCYGETTCTGTQSVKTSVNSYGPSHNTHCPGKGLSYYTYVYGYSCSSCGYDGVVGSVYAYGCGCGWNSGGSPPSGRRCTTKTTALTCTLGNGYWTRDSGYTLNCGKVEGSYYNGNILVNVSCNAMCVSINATHPIQTAYLNDPLITTVTATFRDGSTRVVIASANFIPNIIVSNRLVILSYAGFTVEIRVTVLPKLKVCGNNHTYKLNGDGTDPGCPYCRAWVSNLSVYIPSNKELSVYKGTTLEDNGVMLLATYFDGRKEYLTNNYAHNLDSNYVGLQTVTVSYKGTYDTLKVVVKRNIKQCNVCLRYYELHPDNTDPGCPYCASLIPVFTGNVMEYYTVRNTEEILRELFEGSGSYLLNEGDYLSVDIESRTNTNAMNILNRLYGSTYRFKTSYGVKIRDVGK